MRLTIVKYGHPILRQKGAVIPEVTPEIQQLISEMIETMISAHGVGLAAQQVGRPLQLMVLDIREVDDRPSVLEWEGQPADPTAWMPMALVNPQIKPVGRAAKGPEGCLSFPELFADVVRPEWVEVTAQNPEGQQITFRAGGLLGRAIQHEYDHLQGILFIDRMDAETVEDLRPELEDLQSQTKAELKRNRLGRPASETGVAVP